MNFKDQVAQDLTNVFHNSAEHAEILEFWIDNTRYKGPVVFDDIGSGERKKPSTDHADGLILADFVMYAPLSLLKTVPRKGLQVEVVDGDIYTITKVNNEAGEIVIYMEALTE